MSFYDEGIVLGEAMSEEASLHCVDPQWNKIISTVIFKNPERPDMLLDEYLQVIMWLGGRSMREEYRVSGPEGLAFTAFESGLYDALKVRGSLDDQTRGPYPFD